MTPALQDKLEYLLLGAPFFGLYAFELWLWVSLKTAYVDRYAFIACPSPGYTSQLPPLGRRTKLGIVQDFDGRVLRARTTSLASSTGGPPFFTLRVEYSKQNEGYWREVRAAPRPGVPAFVATALVFAVFAGNFSTIWSAIVTLIVLGLTSLGLNMAVRPSDEAISTWFDSIEDNDPFI